MQGIVWRCMVMWCLIGGVGFAGNRADVNADQSVDALDLAELTNVLAGNLDVAAYELENVVVVAPSGGDFDNPADAADWVISQGPTALNRYVILITPGYYLLNRTLVVPEYTTIKGYGSNATDLVWATSGVAEPAVKFQGPTAYCMRIEGLTIYNGGNSFPGPVIGVLVEDCRPEIFNCHIKAQNSNGLHDPIGIRVVRSTETTYVTVKNCEVTGVSSSNGSGVPTAIEAYDSVVFAYDSALYAVQHSSDKYAYVLTMESNVFSPTLYIHRCDVEANAGAGYEYYLFRFGTHGKTRFYTCQFDTEDATNVSTGGDLKMAYCYDGFGDPFP